MATLNSITGTLSSTSSLRGYGGLSSGLDRDSLIESLTYGTRTKIENQKAKQTKLQWEQTAIRNITDKVYDFTNNYTSYGSSTNLTSNVLFSRNNVSATGEYSKYVSVSGTVSGADQISIAGVKQLAQNAKLSGASASVSTMATGEIDLAAEFDADMMDGKSLSVKYGEKTYYVSFGNIKETDAYKEGNMDEALAELINKAFAEVDTSDAKKLSDIMKAEVSGGKVTFSDVGSEGNALEIIGGSALETLGFLAEGQKVSDLGEDALNLKVNSSVEAAEAAKPTEKTTYGEFLAGKKITFTYNGISKEITLDENISDMAALASSLQAELNEAFGKGRIEVSETNGALSFRTVVPGVEGDNTDKTSTFSIKSADKDLLGENGALKITKASANRVDLTKTIAEAGLANASAVSGAATLRINDVDIEIAADDTVQDIMDKINESAANVKISYQSDADRFVISANESGASGSIKLEGTVADALFGAGTSGREVTGQDAIIAIKYAGDDDITEIRRDNNSFTMDGMTVNVNGTFGYENGAYVADTEAVKIEANVDTDKTIEVVKNMIAAYNEIVNLINSELKTKPDKDYNSPLTGSQKEDMSEDEIKEYEKNAKQGLLFGDTDLRSFSQDLRYVLAGADVFALSEIGITESSEYSDNGKLVLDEAKFKAALESDPEKINDLLNRKASTDENGKAVAAGLMTNIKDVFDKYCRTTGAAKGILIERAGSQHSPLSLLKNNMKTEIDEIAKYIETLLDRLESEEDRYISQFSSLETLISQMNSQSSYLSSLNGY